MTIIDDKFIAQYNDKVLATKDRVRSAMYAAQADLDVYLRGLGYPQIHAEHATEALLTLVGIAPDGESTRVVVLTLHTTFPPGDGIKTMAVWGTFWQELAADFGETYNVSYVFPGLGMLLSKDMCEAAKDKFQSLINVHVCPHETSTGYLTLIEATDERIIQDSPSQAIH